MHLQLSLVALQSVLGLAACGHQVKVCQLGEIVNGE